jgi:hypothetical protein
MATSNNDVSIRVQALSFAIDASRGRMPRAAELVDDAAKIERYIREGKNEWTVDHAAGDLIARWTPAPVVTKASHTVRAKAKKPARKSRAA